MSEIRQDWNKKVANSFQTQHGAMTLFCVSGQGLEAIHLAMCLHFVSGISFFKIQSKKSDERQEHLYVSVIP